MNTKLSIFCGKIIEAGWLATVAGVPLFFNIHTARTFEPDKLTLMRSIVIIMVLAWLIKVLEEGAATLSKEEAGRLAQRQQKFIQHLQAALVRIENKTYGICRETGVLISKERLRAVPHATLCIAAKSKQ